MWKYEKRLEFPVNIKEPNAKMAMFIMSQYGGPKGKYLYGDGMGGLPLLGPAGFMFSFQFCPKALELFRVWLGAAFGLHLCLDGFELL